MHMSFSDVCKGLLQGYNNGEPISREFFDEHISGGHNILLSKFLWPDRDQEWRDNFSDEKEALFRKYAGVTLSLFPSLHPRSIVEYCDMLTTRICGPIQEACGVLNIFFRPLCGLIAL